MATRIENFNIISRIYTIYMVTSEEIRQSDPNQEMYIKCVPKTNCNHHNHRRSNRNSESLEIMITRIVSAAVAPILVRLDNIERRLDSLERRVDKIEQVLHDHNMM